MPVTNTMTAYSYFYLTFGNLSYQEDPPALGAPQYILL